VLISTKMKITWFLPSRSLHLGGEEAKISKEFQMKVPVVIGRVLMQLVNLETFYGGCSD
jgi:hypothetical protein